jgi:CubicO group peptidase (beta-lactamase class C family)
VYGAQARPNVHGAVASGFEPVRERFGSMLAAPGELGAAVDGRTVVDLWGGAADHTRAREWREDTLVLCFSATKGLSAAAVAVAQARGLLDLEAPVAAYWPEFARAGKQAVTVRQLLAHQAGLAALNLELNVEVIADWDRLTLALAAQHPRWDPGTRHGYHSVTLGFYESELLRRVDPQGRRLGAFFRDEVARPLGVEFYIGLPSSVPAGRVANVHGWPAWEMALHLRALPAAIVGAYMVRGSLTARTLGNPRLASPAEMDSPAYRALEFPAGTGVGSARALATVYGDLATGGQRLGLDAATFRSLTQLPLPPTGGPRDMVFHIDTCYSNGFWRPFPAFPFGRQRAFGTPGAGGAMGFADPDKALGYGVCHKQDGVPYLGRPARTGDPASSTRLPARLITAPRTTI